MIQYSMHKIKFGKKTIFWNQDVSAVADECSKLVNLSHFGNQRLYFLGKKSDSYTALKFLPADPCQQRKLMPLTKSFVKSRIINHSKMSSFFCRPPTAVGT